MKDQSAGFSGGVYDYAGNLSLTQVMAFYWDLETFTITTAGSISGGSGFTSGIGSVTLNPIGGSPFNRGTTEGAWFGQLLTNTVWASFPTFLVPRSRVCNSYNPSAGFVGYLSGDQSTHTANNFTVGFAISTDPSNAGKYRLYYSVRFDFVTGASLRFVNPAGNTGRVLASGSYSISGISLNWQATDFSTATSSSGLSVSATSGSYTY